MTTAPLSLSEFLLARIEEDEAAAAAGIFLDGLIFDWPFRRRPAK